MRIIWTWLSYSLLGMALGLAEEPAERVDFDRDIRPVLADHCFQCHGPDATQRQSDLRLDVRSGALADLDGDRAVVPGDVDASALIQRITAEDAAARMPPTSAGRPLTSHEIALLGQWIEQGAVWGDHWAFLAPRRPALPNTRRTDWSANPIDDFVLAQLEREGSQPATEAGKRALIRRVTLDLTGLPPIPAEVEAFLNDQSPQAYERVVDRLLQSPRFGERMALTWLDAARYADTSGYQNDGPRSMWRWRDWVINAFNQSMPFDQFTVEQLAGDLLPEPTLDQIIATGFNRNHRGNAEGGIIPEEYQVEYVVDRVDTTFTVWMGLTMGCARCHDHKYDPLTQEQFYQAFAYFNNVPEYGRAVKEGNSPPYVQAPLPAQQQALADLDQRIRTAEEMVARLSVELVEAQRHWEASRSTTAPIDWTLGDGIVAHLGFDDNLIDAARPDATVNFTAEGAYVAGRLGQAVYFDGTTVVNAGDVGEFGYFDKFSLSLWFRSEDGDGTLVSRMVPVENGEGYYVGLQDGRLQVNLVKRWLDDAIRLESRDVLPLDVWRHLTVTYDGTRLASGVRVYVDGQPLEMVARLDALNQTFSTKEPLRVGGGSSPLRGSVDDVRVYARDLTADEALLLAVADSVSEILAVPPAQRTSAQRSKLAQYFLEQLAPQPIRAAHQELTSLRRQRRTLVESLPTVMVMEEMESPRITHILHRGRYDQPGDRVTPDVPSIFPGLPSGVENNRLGFALWLVDPRHPLTARVAVNRVWQMFFGEGLVRTAENLGVQGENPSHPQLLDWLATELIRSRWDIKRLQRLIVTSATYRQASKASPELLRRDPENRLLARGPRHRLSAEAIRDQALLLSGLLTEKQGGPSVKPYQPDGLWKEIATDADYQQAHGESLYRRSLYTYWKRTVAPPSMATFDASAREACVVKRSTTNTPLQALTLMNDVTFVEAARVMAQRLMTEFQGTVRERLHTAFELATARTPRPAELEVLMHCYQRSLQAYRKDQAAAEALVGLGKYPRTGDLETAVLAAYTNAASLILNLDEVVTKE